MGAGEIVKSFGRSCPETVMAIEERFRLRQKKKDAKRSARRKAESI